MSLRPIKYYRSPSDFEVAGTITAVPNYLGWIETEQGRDAGRAVLVDISWNGVTGGAAGSNFRFDPQLFPPDEAAPVNGSELVRCYTNYGDNVANTWAQNPTVVLDADPADGRLRFWVVIPPTGPNDAGFMVPFGGKIAFRIANSGTAYSALNVQIDRAIVFA